jgi:hypothetical protein
LLTFFVELLGKLEDVAIIQLLLHFVLIVYYTQAFASGDDIYSPGIILNYTFSYRFTSGVAASFNKGVFINGVLPALLTCAAVSLSFRPSASLLLLLPIVD